LRVPGDVHGRDFADHPIRRWEFRELRLTGSHLVLRTESPAGLTISIPAHKPLRVGTFRDVLEVVSSHKNVTPEDLVFKL
jgi:predicted RNA binding protein YcfA (HicA-like mRNA interferase family)